MSQAPTNPAAKPEEKPTAPPAPKTEEQRQADALAALEADRAKRAPAAQDTPVADIAKPAAPPKAAKPDGVPDKFWNAEKGEVDYKAWGESHKSLETQFHKKPDGATEQPKPNGEQPKPSSARETATAEYARDGKLSDATYKALEAEGFDRDTVDTYIEGQRAKVAPIKQALSDGAEGEENYSAMIAWAAENLDEVEIESYNATLTSKNPAVLKAASAALYAKYRATVPVEGNRTGGGAPAGNSGAFQSKAEMTAAMSDPRYATDSAYRDQVAQKMLAARRAGIDLFA